MPAYNAERYVRAAIESVLDNGFADFELVVVDDASTDSTAQIIEAIRHPALRFVRQAENLGVGATRQAAISLLRGQCKLPYSTLTMWRFPGASSGRSTGLAPLMVLIFLAAGSRCSAKSKERSRFL